MHVHDANTGKLQHAAKVVKSGRTFVRRLFDLIAKFKKPDHHVKLNASARSDLAWWCHFVEMIFMNEFCKHLISRSLWDAEADREEWRGEWPQQTRRQRQSHAGEEADWEE